MLLTVAAIMLLGTVILSTNRRIATTSSIMSTANYGLEDVALATKIIQEAQSKAFDQATADSLPISGVSSFSATLGQESGSNDFDDFDDYNGYSPLFSNLATGDYRASVTVRYVKYNPTTKTIDTTSTRQWSKRIDVAVWNTVDPANVVRMHAIMSFWR